jgi:hypothetical protein
MDQALPMLNRWKVDVVRHGPSPHDTDSYYLMRSFASLEDREQSEEAFYGSDEWKLGPREAILAKNQNNTKIVMEMEGSTVKAVRQ